MSAPNDITTDRLELYRWAVQDPETHATVLQVMYEHVRDGRSPTVLREDFAGTSAESVAWVALEEGRRAIAVDLDAPTLAWARARADRILGADAERVAFVHGDVMHVAPPQVPEADLIAVLNFSICYFTERPRLLAYLAHARRCLAPDGVLVLNTFGGPGAMEPSLDRRAVTPTPRLESEAAIAPFDYTWEHRSYDAVSGVLDCRIHFDVPSPDGGRVLRDAFTYRFRLWGLAELREVLLEAGFADAQVWRHTWDPTQGEDGLFLGPVDTLPDTRQWLAYLVAQR